MGRLVKMRQCTSAADEEVYTEFVNVKANPLRELFMVDLNQQQKTRAGQLAFARSTDVRSSGRIFCRKRGQAQKDRLRFSGWPGEKKRAGHEPSVNATREAGGIFAPISGPMECCDDLDATMGRCRTMRASQATAAISSRLAQTRPWRSLPTTQY